MYNFNNWLEETHPEYYNEGFREKLGAFALGAASLFGGDSQAQYDLKPAKAAVVTKVNDSLVDFINAKDKTKIQVTLSVPITKDPDTALLQEIKKARNELDKQMANSIDPRFFKSGGFSKVVAVTNQGGQPVVSGDKLNGVKKVGGINGNYVLTVVFNIKYGKLDPRTGKVINIINVENFVRNQANIKPETTTTPQLPVYDATENKVNFMRAPDKTQIRVIISVPLVENPEAALAEAIRNAQSELNKQMVKNIRSGFFKAGGFSRVISVTHTETGELLSSNRIVGYKKVTGKYVIPVTFNIQYGKLDKKTKTVTPIDVRRILK